MSGTPRLRVDSCGVDELHAHVLGELGLQETMDWAAELALQDVRCADFASLIVPDLKARSTRVVAATDPLALHLYEVECDANEGPGLAASRIGEISHVRRTNESAAMWTKSAAACVAQGVQSVLAVPFEVAGGRFGALSLFAETGDAFTARDIERAVEFAAAAGVVLTNVAAFWDARYAAASLAAALESRAVIDQAKGILMHTMLCGADEAFQMLVEQSQFENRKVRAISEELVARTTRATPGHPERAAPGATRRG